VKPAAFILLVVSVIGASSAETVGAVSTNSVGFTPSPAFDTTGSMIRVMGALGIVFAVFFGGIWLFRNWQRLLVKRGVAPRLNVLEARSIGNRQSILVVAYGEQRLLVGAAPSGLSLLSHLPSEEGSPEAVSTPASPGRPTPSFVEAFQKVLSAKR
jgi:flagellar biogenesis protein FliO